MEILVLFSIFFVCIMVVAIGLSIMNYVFTGFGLMKMGETMGEKAPWLSWIPYANQFMLGKLGMNNTIGILLVASNAVSAILGGMIGFLGNLAEELTNSGLDMVIVILGIIIMVYSIAVAILYFVACHNLFKKFSDKATVMTVVNVLTGGAIAPIFIFAIRNNQLRE